MADTEESNRSEKLNIYMLNVLDECKKSMCCCECNWD